MKLFEFFEPFLEDHSTARPHLYFLECQVAQPEK